MTETELEIWAAIEAAQHIAIGTHTNPDGDAIGSTLGLGLALRAMGKTVTLLTEETIPSRFNFLRGSEAFTQRFPDRCDFYIALDCGDQARLGRHRHHAVDLNIDHHKTNTMFGRYNIVWPDAASTTEMLTTLAERWGLALPPASADALLCGLITDTLGFSVSSTTPATLETAQTLLAAGANLPVVYRKGQSEQSLEAMRVWGVAIDRIQQDDGLLWTSLPLEEKRRVGYTAADDADAINIIRNISGPDVYIILVERGDRETKISWRSNWVDVSQAALIFGGGGHAPAAGATVDLPLDEAIEEVVARTREVLAAARQSRTR